MIDLVGLNTIADAVLAAHTDIEKFGTDEMKIISRTLLFTVGKEIAQRSKLTDETQDLHYEEPERP